MSLVIDLIYLFSASLFIIGLKKLSSPKTARRGNQLSSLAMLIAIVVTLFDKQILDFTYIIAGLIIGGIIGLIAAQKVEMTAMPQMVALFNAFGGIASALVVMAQFYHNPVFPHVGVNLTVTLSLLVGMITFTGSIVAFAKLQGLISGAPIVLPIHQIINGLLGIVSLTLITLFTLQSGLHPETILLLLLGISFLLGILLIIPIGGADMPVVISLLNSFSGIAAAFTGFVVHNSVLIVSGALVGASGLILTNLMCVAMNRSLWNVLFGAVGTDGGFTGTNTNVNVTRYTPIDAGVVLERSQSVIIVPGYGLAVAQAQYAMQELVEYLTKQNIEVKYAIHPVAGRMPGHMNVLLAEANVPYEMLKDMEEINPEFSTTETVLIVGANDVTNPVAREKNNSLSGMPILNVDEAQNIIIIKRSLSPGFAGVDNPLFYDPKTMMVFGDAKEMLIQIANYFKEI
ncbi:MAG: NAD(P)(+) transhydrogenase (Re/Si-specific) subunit beta [Calditrichia bacterium]